MKAQIIINIEVEPTQVGIETDVTFKVECNRNLAGAMAVKIAECYVQTSKLSAASALSFVTNEYKQNRTLDHIFNSEIIGMGE